MVRVIKLRYVSHSGFKETKTYSSQRTISIDEVDSNMLYDFIIQQQQLFEQFKIENPLNQIFYPYIEGIVSINSVNQSLRRAYI